MSKLELNSVQSGYASTALLNSNFEAISGAFDTVLSLDGTSPNQMEASLDMNSNTVINVGSPVNPNDAVRLSDIGNLQSQILSLAANGAIPSTSTQFINICQAPYLASHTQTATFNTTAMNTALVAASIIGAEVYWDQPLSLNVVTVPQNAKIRGGGAACPITPAETSGGWIFSWPNNSQNFYAKDIWIVGNVATPLASTNCGGIKLGTDTNNTVQRYSLTNCHIVGVANAFQINGYVGYTQGLYAGYISGIGLQGSQMNAVALDIKFENCAQPFKITDSTGLLFVQPLIEGTVGQTTTATLDNSNSVTLLTSYTEEIVGIPNVVPYISIGVTTACTQVTITGSFTGYNGVVSGIGVPIIYADKCDGLYVKGYTNQSQPIGGRGGGLVVQTTANTRNYKNEIYSTGGFSGPFTTDASKSLSPQALNYFPNPNLELWLRGWQDVQYGNCVGVKETTIVRRGANALKVTANNMAVQPAVQFHITGDAVTSVQSKLMRMCAWVYIPAITAYTSSSGVTHPGIDFFCHDSAGNVFSSTITNRDTVGSWTLFHCTNTPQADCTDIYLRASPNQNTNACNGTEYIIVDSIFLVEESVPLDVLINGCLVNSHNIMSIGRGGRMEMTSSSIPSDANQIMVDGDICYNPSPAAAGFIGSVCTTGGAASSAVWKTFGVISA